MSTAEATTQSDDAVIKIDGDVTPENIMKQITPAVVERIKTQLGKGSKAALTFCSKHTPPGGTGD